MKSSLTLLQNKARFACGTYGAAKEVNYMKTFKKRLLTFLDEEDPALFHFQAQQQLRRKPHFHLTIRFTDLFRAHVRRTRMRTLFQIKFCLAEASRERV